MTTNEKIETLRWYGDYSGYLELIDQTLLPVEFQKVVCHDVETVWSAIKKLQVRGAPAIGIAAAYGVCIGLAGIKSLKRLDFLEHLHKVVEYLADSRPTAVNLFWALDRMKYVAETVYEKDLAIPEILTELLNEAKAIHQEDRLICRKIGEHGSDLLEDGQGVLTHCNAGGLATAEYGTALAVFFASHESGKNLHVYVDETRPLLQGARLTAWELQQHGIQATLICDSMAAQVMREGRVQAVITGADRIAANGDSANKIGTYSIAVLAKAHNIPFYIAAPCSTFDMTITCGDEIPIEQRSGDEITHGFGRQTAPQGIDVYNPAFDVTPAKLIQAIITERGIIQKVDSESIAEVVQP